MGGLAANSVALILTSCLRMLERNHVNVNSSNDTLYDHLLGVMVDVHLGSCTLLKKKGVVHILPQKNYNASDTL